MFIGSGRPAEASNGSFRSLNNVDYYKRYIIIEIPESNLNMICQITVVNISSTSGKSYIGIFDPRERRQVTHVYHGYGMPFRIIPSIIDKSAKNLINFDSLVFINDISYGSHIYDLRRSRFSELMTYTSYVDMLSEPEMFTNVPFVTFYNKEHQILNEEINKQEYKNGALFLNIGELYGYSNLNKYSVKLQDLMDDHTRILITRSSNFNNYNLVEPVEGDPTDNECSLENLTLLIIGPITDLLMGLIFNEINFSYDSEEGLSRLQYKTDHKLPNDVYRNQIEANCLSAFESDMDYITTALCWRFRLFVHCSLGNVRIRFIKYDKYGGQITKNFNYDIGRFRNEQHIETKNWLLSG